MTQFTSRLSLTKPGGGSTGTNLPAEPVDIDVINANMDKLDSVVGTPLYTSASRPAAPFVGQTIYETDTFNTAIWTGSTWRYTVSTGYSEATRSGQSFGNAANQTIGQMVRDATRSLNDSWITYNNTSITLQPGFYIVSLDVTLPGSQSSRTFLEFQNAGGTSLARNGTSTDSKYTLTMPYRVLNATSDALSLQFYQSSGGIMTPNLFWSRIQRVS